jgi:probable rRNA maturation factor
MVFTTIASNTSKKGQRPAQTAGEGLEMEILIENRQSSCEISQEKIEQTVRVILDALDCAEAEISILITDDPTIEELNRKYLHRNGPTNVIAFPMREGEFAHLTPQLLGDVVISTDTAAREAKSTAMSIEQRFKELLVHGILHLLGYDHETSGPEARKMEIKNQELLKLI